MSPEERDDLMRAIVREVSIALDGILAIGKRAKVLTDAEMDLVGERLKPRIEAVEAEFKRMFPSRFGE